MNIENITPIELVTQTDEVKNRLLEYHKILTNGVSQKRFEGLLKEIVTPALVGLYGDIPQGIAVREITTYVENLIPKIKTPKMEKLFDQAGAPMLDKRGKQIEQYVKGPDGMIESVEVPAFEMSLGAYKQLRDIVNQSFMLQRMYWLAHEFVGKHLEHIDETLFDKMNDYTWRHIMAVKYPEDVKREFKHFCINIKRKLYYLGDRDEVHDQTVFGLYSYLGGTGKSTLLKGFEKAFSDGHGYELDRLESFFNFNGDTKDKFGVMFVDEEAKGQKTDVKNCLKKFVDSDERRVEMKGVDAFTVRNLLSMVVSANHKIAPSIFEDEARGQRRDATFEAIGLLQQYSEKDMRTWFDKMFDVCPFEDDFKTYHHHNPHHEEVIEREYAILSKIVSNVSTQSPKCLTEWANALDIKSGSPEWYALRPTLKLTKFFSTTSAHGTTLYAPIMKSISAHVSDTTKSLDWWNEEWKRSRPWIDVKAVIDSLQSSAYDTSSPIKYDEYMDEQEESKTDNKQEVM